MERNRAGARYVSIALGPAAGFAGVASALELQFRTALGAGVLDVPGGSLGILGFRDSFELALHFVVHIPESPTDRHGTAGTDAGVSLGVGAHDI